MKTIDDPDYQQKVEFRISPDDGPDIVERFDFLTKMTEEEIEAEFRSWLWSKFKARWWRHYTNGTRPLR